MISSASLGIWYSGVGDIFVTSLVGDILVDGAVLKAPHQLMLAGNVVGTAADTTKGTLACP